MKKVMIVMSVVFVSIMSLIADTWTDPDTGYTWRYYADDDTVYMIGTGVDGEIYPAISPSPTGAVTIPSVLGGKPVRSIWNNAFYGCNELTSVTIPDSVTRIGDDPFRGCSNLKNLTVPQCVCYRSMSSVFPSVYQAITNVVVSDGVTSIGDYAFSSCRGLTSVTIPDSVTNIGASAFSSCSGLTSVTIPDSVTNIGIYAFYDCTNLTNVAIPDSVTNIGDWAFYGCSGLADEGGFIIVRNVLYGYCGLGGNIIIPNSITNIGNSAFSNCKGITSVTIPDSVTSIGMEAFYQCRDLTNVTIPNSVTCIGDGAFCGCTKLTGITIPDSVISIGEYTFRYSGLTSIALPDSVTSIEEYAFSFCRGLKSLIIPDSITSIGDYAFLNCNNLMSVTIPNSVTNLPATAFEGCDRLWTAWYRTLANTSAAGSSGDNGSSSGACVSLAVTNVVVHYVTASMPSAAVTVPTASGIVNVISEVNAGAAVAITADWATQYPGFGAKFGSDFTVAVTKPTGKTDDAGRPMMVWQDFVAGTDPTNPGDVFKASITFDKTTNKPIISWTPELSAAEAAKRTYRTFGKKRLTDSDWMEIDGDADDYNFFKVSVEMR